MCNHIIYLIVTGLKIFISILIIFLRGNLFLPVTFVQGTICPVYGKSSSKTEYSFPFQTKNFSSKHMNDPASDHMDSGIIPLFNREFIQCTVIFMISIRKNNISVYFLKKPVYIIQKYMLISVIPEYKPKISGNK